VIACVLAAAVAACSSSSTSSKPPASSSGEPQSGTAAQQQIATNWAAFFSPKTPTQQRVALLQDGQTFAPVIRAQEGSGLVSAASASVSKVTVTAPSQATVHYSILLNGQPALPNQSGIAVLEGGTWKVGVSSFCGLLALESGGNTASLPAACKTAP
jgi:hypothetical protein